MIERQRNDEERGPHVIKDRLLRNVGDRGRRERSKAEKDALIDG